MKTKEERTKETKVRSTPHENIRKQERKGIKLPFPLIVNQKKVILEQKKK